ncbi:hypothetical protein KUCAC02_028991 [Chaenocephalus aceratus]|uniref:Uncharacterized protein n=1 Tax=Chaenocephalus aceratus TaxID=36190 RepID=A0ACB9X448_CHAAC|nr:hypothetical protein KUCAC02_028991 [Chaenocephalus aceratus]
MIQEVKESHVSTKKRTLPLYDRSSKMRSLKITPPETLPELAFKRVGPKFPKNANFTPPAENQVQGTQGPPGQNGHVLALHDGSCKLVFMMDFAVKTNNFELFHHCNGAMADLFFAYDGHNYARYLTWFEAFLTNIDLSHPGALAAVDKTMEETFMRFAKTSGGLLGLFNNCGAYQKWCRTTSARAQLYELTLEMCGMIDDPEMPKAGKHRELEPAQIKKSELAVQSVISAINGFTNPWRIPDKSRLKDFFDRLKKLTLKTMDYCSKRVKLTSAQGKLFVYKEQSNLAFQLLVKSQIMEMPINLEELMRYPLSPVPHALGSPDGYFAKTNKWDGEYEHEEEELEMEEIELEDLFSDDEDDE